MTKQPTEDDVQDLLDAINEVGESHPRGGLRPLPTDVLADRVKALEVIVVALGKRLAELERHAPLLFD